jgi:hypothetical protein
MTNFTALNVTARLMAFEYNLEYPEAAKQYVDAGIDLAQHSIKVMSKYTEEELICLGNATTNRLLEKGIPMEILIGVVNDELEFHVAHNDKPTDVLYSF